MNVLEKVGGKEMVSRMGGEAVVNPTVSNVEKQIIDAPVQEFVVQKVEEEKPLSVDKAKQMTESMNNFLESANTQLRFKLHEKLNQYYVAIVDTKTDEVVKEIPSKKLMDIHAAMREFVGLLVDRKI